MRTAWFWLNQPWFSRWWWAYLLTGCKSCRHFACRVNRHQDGPVFYNAGGLEPDWRCANCGEYLG